MVNAGNDTRIHLVADTVGGARFWDLLSAGRPPDGDAYIACVQRRATQDRA